MKYYYLKAPACVFGDDHYSVVHGLSMHLCRSADGNIMLERCGPKVPPISFPLEVVITDRVKQAIEESRLTGIKYMKVIAAKVVDFDFEKYDLSDMSEDQDAAGVIYSRPHSPGAASKMPNLWELIPQNGAQEIRCSSGSISLVASSIQRLDFFRGTLTSRCYVSPEGMVWLRANYLEYVEFDMADVDEEHDVPGPL